MIDHERLEAYRYALDFVRQTVSLREPVLKGSGELVDQFRRASFSLVLNIAEGAGKVRKPDKQRFYAIARGSAFECAALLDLFQVCGMLPDTEHQRLKEILRRVVAMICGLCRR